MTAVQKLVAIYPSNASVWFCHMTYARFNAEHQNIAASKYSVVVVLQANYGICTHFGLHPLTLSFGHAGMLREGNYGAFYQTVCQGAAGNKPPDPRPLEFTHVMIDEAGQARTPAVPCCALFCCTVLRCARLCCAVPHNACFWSASAMLCTAQ